MSATACPVHQTPWKTIPAGISKKTGEPYLAFQVCQDASCTQRPPKKTMSAQPVGNIPAPQTQAKPDWDKIARGKVKHGVVTSAIIHDGLFDLTPEKTVQIENLVNLIMDEGEEEVVTYSDQDWETSL